MTLYYQIIETSDVESVVYRVRKAWNFFGFIISIPTVERWVPKRTDSTTLYMTIDCAGEFDSLEEAKSRAINHASETIREDKKRKSTKHKLVDTVIMAG